ncbi:MAG: EAL domain-containing protein [Candidatus Faecousia sp.]|nr:EAL domain-containing protein [Candidatus Faecousia sp.]
MQKSNVLIVDDAPINRELLAYILQDRYQVFQAENGKQAIEMIESQERIYRLVLLDIQMPVLDGFGFLDYMKKKDLLRNLPVIVISGDSSDASILYAYKLGAVDFFSKPFSPEIVLNRVHNILSLYEHDYKDDLTGGYNRTGFIRMAENVLYNAKKKSDYALMFFDIKNFKATNELFGVGGGDNFLRDFYQRIDKIWNPSVSARLDADHFVCLLPQSHINMDTLSQDLKLNVQLGGRAMKLYGYCGIYHVEDDDVSVTSMIDRAKLAEESILSDHIQPYVVFDDSMRRRYVNQMELMGEYESAIANDEFKVYYQPVVEASSGNLISAEALVRWIHPQRGMVSPADFIPALENGGHISKLDWFIANRVAELSRERHQAGEPVVPVSVNLSWMDFYNDDMMQGLVELLGSDRVRVGDIRLEITETSYAALESDREGILEQLRKLGSPILLDDFGSGFSSFGMLKRYNFDILKLDMTFTRQIETSPKTCTIITGIIQMVHHLGIKVIAEGAETEAQVKFLRDNGCDYIQGYYFSKPLPEEEFLAYIQKRKEEGRLGPAKKD